MKVNAGPPVSSADAGETYHALRDGRLSFQRCRACTHAWLPERTECPSCLGNDLERRDASGAARLISWVVYYTAVVPSFANRIPYTVGIVELEEGPRLISNIVEVEEPELLAIDQALRLVVGEKFGASVPLFVPINAIEGAARP